MNQHVLSECGSKKISSFKLLMVFVCVSIQFLRFPRSLAAAIINPLTGSDPITLKTGLCIFSVWDQISQQCLQKALLSTKNMGQRRSKVILPNHVIDVVPVNALQPLGGETHRDDVWINVWWSAAQDQTSEHSWTPKTSTQTSNHRASYHHRISQLSLLDSSPFKTTLLGLAPPHKQKV